MTNKGRRAQDPGAGNGESGLLTRPRGETGRKATPARWQSRWAHGLNVGARVLGIIGRHPLPVLILPSLWMFCRYLPFWKDADSLNSLVLPFSADNLLHFPPLYGVLGRVPFWITDTLLLGSTPGVFSPQHPSLAAVYALAACQHALLWAALRYFAFSLPAADAGRGAATVGLASVASFYAFAHTLGTEVMVPITWFAVFGAGLRLLFFRVSWPTLTVYTLALFGSIGSRHVCILLLGWLPVTAALLAAHRRRVAGPGPASPARQALAIAAIAAVLGGAVLGAEQLVVTRLCQHFGVVVRSTMGSTLSDRIGSFLDRLPPAERRRVAQRALSQVRETDPQRAEDTGRAIEALATVGTYQLGTGKLVEEALARRGLSGENLGVERDRIVLDAVKAYYQTYDRRLLTLILMDVGKGFYPTNDQGIALTGAKSTFDSLPLIAERPRLWAGVSDLPMFQQASVRATLDRAFHDNFIRHWRFLPIGAWSALFLGVGLLRSRLRSLPPEPGLVGMTTFAVGFVTYAANCVCVYSMPRYVLPLLVAVFASGAMVSVARAGSQPGRGS